MKNVSQVRDRVVRGTVDMLEHLRIRISMLPETDVDVLVKLERPHQFDLAEELAKFLMEKLGHSTAPKEPRFDKTRRALAKQTPRLRKDVFMSEEERLSKQRDKARRRRDRKATSPENTDTQEKADGQGQT
jgi:hypothetical protein